MNVVRGQVVQAHIGLDEPKLLVVVSNNGRNRSLDTVLGVRVTTTPPRRSQASIVAIPDGEGVHGWARCDDIEWIEQEGVLKVVTALSPNTMLAINTGLRSALAL